MNSSNTEPKTVLSTDVDNFAILTQLIDENKIETAVNIILNTIRMNEFDVNLRRIILMAIMGMTGYYDKISNPVLILKFLKNLYESTATDGTKNGKWIHGLALRSLYSLIYKLAINNSVNFKSEIINLPNGANIEGFINNLDQKGYEKLVQSLSSIPHFEGQHNLIKKLLEKCINTGNLEYIFKIKDYYPDIYRQSVNDFTITHPTLINIINKIDRIHDTEYKSFVIEHMKQLTMGYGKIGPSGALVALAAVNKIKDNIAPTVIINDVDNYEKTLNDFISAIAKAQKPTREGFVVMGHHSFSCEIRIDEKGKASVLIIDPKGFDIYPDSPSRAYFDQIEILASIITKIFPDNYSIFLAKDKRQGATVGCSVFAMDDVVRLSSVDKFIDNNEYPRGLMEYLNKHTVDKDVEINGIKYQIATLPLYMIRTMQSTKLLDLLDNQHELDKPLNNKGTVTPKLIIEKKLGFIERDTKHGRKLQNTRLEAKLLKFTERTLEYLLNHDLQTVRDEMKARSLEGYKEKINRPPERSVNTSNETSTSSTACVDRPKSENTAGQESVNKRARFNR